ncbi:hypothetical protein UYA_09550 [Ectopseudomonas alcaliphila JAB1]|nr:hypothetical protein [Pseudomonas alcaliphila]APU29962.1 hypothetical protein UYA_09550 [Pseudomonas alcaliphila JAB1]
MSHKEALMASLLAEPKKVTFDYGAMISRPVTQDLLKSVQPDGFPLPHGSTYSDITSLTEDIIKRCSVEGYSLLESSRFIHLATDQFNGAPA